MRWILFFFFLQERKFQGDWALLCSGCWTEHLYYWEHNSKPSMIGERVVFWPYPFFDFPGGENCVLYFESNHLLRWVLFNIVPTLTVIFLPLLWTCRIPYPPLQYQESTKAIENQRLCKILTGMCDEIRLQTSLIFACMSNLKPKAFLS